MSRPAYSHAGFVRRLLLSRVRLHVIVEGRAHDPSFFGGIIDASLTLKQAGAELVPVELVTPGGGKRSVIALFDYCRKRGSLRISKSRSESVAAFILDKDSDQITGGLRRSPHVIYTRNYDVEADILEHADLGRAIGAALSLTPSEAHSVATAVGNWQEGLARAWREWIIKCCVAKYYGASCAVGFSRAKSCINTPLYGSVEKKVASERERELFTASKASRADYSGRRKIIERRIDSAIDNHRGIEIVRGKWLPAYLDYLIEPHLPARKLASRRAGGAITSHALLTLDFNSEWTRHYLDRLESL